MLNQHSQLKTNTHRCAAHGASGYVYSNTKDGELGLGEVGGIDRNGHGQYPKGSPKPGVLGVLLMASEDPVAPLKIKSLVCRI